MENKNIFQKIGLPTPKWAKWAAGISGTIGTLGVLGTSISQEIPLPDKVDTASYVAIAIGYVFAIIFGSQVDPEKLKQKLDERKKNEAK